MTPLCSIAGCFGKTIARGMCSKHYYRWYRAEKRRKHSDPEPTQPAITAEQIDALSTDELNYWIKEKVYDWLPPSDPRTLEAFLVQNPDRRQLSRDHPEWLAPDGTFHTWENPSTDLSDAWQLMQFMWNTPHAERFEQMLLEGRFHRISHSMRWDAPKDATVFIARCALKASLLPLT